MRKIDTKTAVIVIASFAVLCTAIVYAASRLPRTSEWEDYQSQYPEKAIRANLRKIVFAANSYMRTNRVNEVRYADILRSSDYLDGPIKPILGEDYKTIHVTGQDTEIEVVTKDGKTISVTFNPLGTSTAGLPIMPRPPASVSDG